MMSSNTVYLVTGVNRGIGRGLVENLLIRPNVTVIGTVRDADAFTKRFTIAENSKFILKEISSTSDDDAATVVASLHSYGVTHIDVVIANAGTAGVFNKVLKTSVSEMTACFEVNTLGPVKLFQATWPLLDKSPSPKFILVSSMLGSIESMDSSAYLAYGMSKAAANFFVRKVHSEHEKVIAFAIQPGWVRTGNGQAYADSVGVDVPPMGVHDSATGILAQIDVATKETTSGQFTGYDGKIVPW